MRLIQPDPAAALLGLRAMKTVVSAGGAIKPAERAMMEAAQKVILRTDHDIDTLPPNVKATHVSLFDGSNCGFELTDRPAFSVQYHPEASPGPQDSFYLFEKFVGAMTKVATKSAQQDAIH